MEVDVEIDTEFVQVRLDAVEHQLGTYRPEGLVLRLGCQRQRFGLLRQHLLCDLGDVLARIAVLRCRLSLGRGDERPAEAIDLSAVIVEVVLASDLGSVRGQDASEGIADSSPSGSTEVHRSGGVGRDELEVDLLACHRGSGAELGTGGQHAGNDLALRCGSQPDVQKAGACDVCTGDRGVGRERLGEPAGEITGIGSGLLRHLQRHVGGVVTVLGIAGTLDRELRRENGCVQAAVGKHLGGGRVKQFGKIGGSHR
ncbi:unannotated protein [freshwater metagenome]|uniref:Unannotated protein n=1 Tax=freshwater metagenome TaxID=449393 RepID=A0A6J7IFK7_9ZZZZ